MDNKLSSIVLQLAKTLLRNPDIPPSSEAGHAALLFVHVAWNKSLGDNTPFNKYRIMLAVLEKDNPSLWNEFIETDHQLIITKLMAAKRSLFPTDNRLIIFCGTRDGNVRVEWS